MLISTFSFSQTEKENSVLCDSNNDRIKKLHGLGDYKEAIELALTTKEICLNGYGKDSPSYLIWINYMSVLHMEIGEFKKAFLFLEEEKEIRERIDIEGESEYGTILRDVE
jgi:hypothetical protein